ncbi:MULTISPECIES: hypothetical protein [unclassified Ruegeria]|uniref:hypothetical protein n=1 Tax=unclassified Ruegeria TaxID=2625375 RepID=UPI0014912A7F|nr:MULTISPECIES: hypothetical protein [unclassified Ruegeria]NOD34306.1 hypothetical protein [Ruegeria sp. HKCCD7296]NOE41330.1 hypothetical protein [Ruegeria sp. HKCCD7319]
MGRFLVSSYSAIIEIALWVFFIGAAVAGGYANGLPGVIVALVTAFLFSIFFIAPFMMVDDIRKSVARLEALKKSEAISYVGGQDMTAPQKSEVLSSPQPKRSSGPVLVGDRIKSYKGKEIIKEEDGVSVDGKLYSNVLAAERAISESA